MSTVSLVVRCDQTQWGEVVGVIGEWCEWDTDASTTLATDADNFPKWRGVVRVPDKLTGDGNTIEYKYVILKDGRVARWENGANRSLPAPPLNAALAFDDGTFGDGGKNQRKRAQSKPVVAKGLPDAREVVRATPTENGYRLGDSPPAGVAAPVPTENLPALERLLVKTTGERKSWRQRLQFVQALIVVEDVDGDGDGEADLAEARADARNVDGLAVIAAYLSFMSSGQLPCAEDGGHHRPNHHAGAAQAIEKALIARDFAAYEPYVARRVYTFLPSYASQFTVSTPLTRIRDIAHRNDIPHELKKEIKKTLQNKLHRCAGPEDLVTCQKLLERVQHGGYSPAFVSELRIFHAELLEFFNAGTLDERLDALEKCNGGLKRSAQHLRRLKTMNGCPLEQLSSLVTLRRTVSESTIMQAGDATAEQQRLRLADIELEKYAFPLLSEVAGKVEKDLEQRAHARLFNAAYDALALAFRNIELSRVRAPEARAIANELQALGKLDEQPATHVGRAKAAIDRAIAFTDNFSAEMTRMYGPRIIHLAAALGVEARAANVFAEAEIRANVSFLASRIAAAGAQACRQILNLPPWDPLFVGFAAGKVLRVVNLEEVPTAASEPLVVIANEATGEEEIPKNVAGVVLGRTLPHLSHLGVRARQARVVFVCAEEASVFDELCAKKSSFATLTVDVSAGISWKEVAESEIAELSKLNEIAKTPTPTPTKLPASSLASSQTLTLSSMKTKTPTLSPTAALAPKASTPTVKKAPYASPSTTPKSRKNGSKKKKKKNAKKGSPTSTVSTQTSTSLPATQTPTSPPATHTPTSPSSTQEPTTPKEKEVVAEVVEYVVPMSKVSMSNAAAKCFGVAQMTKVAQGSDPLFSVPAAAAVIHDAFCVECQRNMDGYVKLVSAYEDAWAAKQRDENTVNAAADATRSFVLKNFRMTPDALKTLQKEMGSCRVMVRSSANAEDTAEMSGAGLYDTIPNVDATDAEALSAAVTQVWASVWTRRAAASRAAYGVPHFRVSMAVLVQHIAPAPISFVAFSRDPVSGSSDDSIYVEAAVGMGEALASGARGTPYRMRIERTKPHTVTTVAWANLSEQMIAFESKDAELKHSVVDYSVQRMTTDSSFREEAARRIAEVVLTLEKTFGGMQDVEGTIEITKDNNIKLHVVQARPQIV